jgi:hypothetical protein
MMRTKRCGNGRSLNFQQVSPARKARRYHVNQIARQADRDDPQWSVGPWGAQHRSAKTYEQAQPWNDKRYERRTFFDQFNVLGCAEFFSVAI